MKPKLTFEKHAFADTILKHKFEQEYDELIGTIADIDLPLSPTGPFKPNGRYSVPKRQKKGTGTNAKYVLKPISQSEWNKRLDERLRKLGWHPQPIAAGHSQAQEQESGLIGDFAKNGVFVEVEFGNSASAYRDMFKFLVSHDNKQAQVGVLICAHTRLGNLFDSGVTTFESIKRNILPYLRITPLPILFIGLDYWDKDVPALRSHYDEMYKVAYENNVQCHTSEKVFKELVFEEQLEDDAIA